MNIKTIVFLSVLTAAAISLSIIESFIPIGLTGAKIGLANIITLIVLVRYSYKEAFLVLLIRIMIVGLFRGFGIGFALSVSGGFVSFMVMLLLYRLSGLDLVTVSVVGSLSHSVGQVIMASIIIGSIELGYYIPLLFIVAVPTGFFVGTAAKVMISRLKLIEN
jgi:heptaprenyl diphosphate synthase